MINGHCTIYTNLSCLTPNSLTNIIPLVFFNSKIPPSGRLFSLDLVQIDRSVIDAVV